MKRLMFYDKNPGDGSIGQKFLLLSWIIGGFLFKLFGKIDEVKGVSSWKEALEWLNSHESISSIQFWGHGSPGAIWIGDEPLVAWKVSGFLEHAPALEKLSNKMSTSALFWTRSCSSFRGRIGRSLAVALRDSLHCRIAGHVRQVGIIQPSIRTLSPFKDSVWDKDPESDSWFTWDNRTVFCLSSTFPDKW